MNLDHLPFDLNAFNLMLETGVAHYEHSAPLVYKYLNELYMRVNTGFIEQAGDSPEVRLEEIVTVQQLWVKTDRGWEWEHPNYATNRIYKLMDSMNISTIGFEAF